MSVGWEKNEKSYFQRANRSCVAGKVALRFEGGTDKVTIETSVVEDNSLERCFPSTFIHSVGLGSDGLGEGKKRKKRERRRKRRREIG